MSDDEYVTVLKARHVELQQAIEDFHGEPQVRGVILTGSGSAFCAGSDLVEIHESFDSAQAEQHWYDQVTQLKQLLEFMLRFPKPIVAAINGWTTGSGLALMLACDIAVAGESSQFALPESRRGLVAGGGDRFGERHDPIDGAVQFAPKLALHRRSVSP